MSAATHFPSSFPVPDPTLRAHRRRELAMARALGVGVGLFLILWGPLSLSRWLGQGPGWANFEAGYFIFYGILLALPYGRVRSDKQWKRLMLLLTAASVVFVFVLVFDVLYIANLFVQNAQPNAAPTGELGALYANADDSGPPLPLPVLNCALVFLALMQAPAAYFSRHPEQMD